METKIENEFKRENISDRDAMRLYNEHSPTAKARFYIYDLHPEKPENKRAFRKSTSVGDDNFSELKEYLEAI